MEIQISQIDLAETEKLIADEWIQDHMGKINLLIKKISICFLSSTYSRYGPAC
jgi:hypothetical protein